MKAGKVICLVVSVLLLAGAVGLNVVGRHTPQSTAKPAASRPPAAQVWVVDTSASFQHFLPQVKALLGGAVPGARGNYVVLIAMSDRTDVLCAGWLDSDAKLEALRSLVANMRVAPDKGTRLNGTLNVAFRHIAHFAKHHKSGTARLWLFSDAFEESVRVPEKLDLSLLPAKPPVQMMLAYFQATDAKGTQLLTALRRDSRITAEVVFPQAARARLSALIAEQERAAPQTRRAEVSKTAAPAQPNTRFTLLRWGGGTLGLALLVWTVASLVAGRRRSGRLHLPQRAGAGPLPQKLQLRLLSGMRAGEVVHEEPNWMPRLRLRLTSELQEEMSAAASRGVVERWVQLPDELVTNSFSVILYRDNDGQGWVEMDAPGNGVVEVNGKPLKIGKRNRLPVQDGAALTLADALELVISLRYALGDDDVSARVGDDFFATTFGTAAKKKPSGGEDDEAFERDLGLGSDFDF